MKNNSSTKWKQAFLGERPVIDRYNHLKSTDPTNPLLSSGAIDENGHFHFSEEFYQKNPYTRPDERDAEYKRETRAAIRFCTELATELESKLSSTSPLKVSPLGTN